MPSTNSIRPAGRALKQLSQLQKRTYSNTPSSPAQPLTSPFAPRHLLSIADLTPTEFSTLLSNASSHKTAIKSGVTPAALAGKLSGKTIALMFSKRSTRTRVSTEAAVTSMGGHPMFLGSGDIQLGVNESLYDTSVVISSMVSAMVARVNAHDEVADLAKHSSVPVINALSADFHPLQTIADFVTIQETFGKEKVQGLKVAWVGDANNVLFDLAIGCLKMGVDIAVAAPAGYTIPAAMKQLILASAPKGSTAKLTETNVPEEAIENSDILVTDTWISMGQEEESAKRLKAFAGYQITEELAKRGGAKDGWRFMHCLPRHSEEVDDEVFYGKRSLVFPEAENRLWAAISALEGFVVNKGNIV
ncbi:Ornithine carbamoyltransferase, mitochondrial [Lachnellula willkommii]|uniref:Ornithine carbamoyltransferase, mitochondrial n=1 Tax=Lachnellula willkommii TaxID=215461 RepID=A0A559MMV4_9HELO|nr:Ornithine carbamoyltransferase, mitochondrial [Lachnellula willkommii]